MGLPRWKRTGGRDFVFYHSHPGFEWDDLDVTTAYQETVCNDFQVRVACRHLSKQLGEQACPARGATQPEQFGGA